MSLFERLKTTEEINAEFNSCREATEKMREKYPDVMEEIQEVAKAAGFEHILIDIFLKGAAAKVRETYPGTIFWSQESIKNIDILKKFALEFASQGIRMVTIHEKEHLRGPAKEAARARERILEKGEWKNIQDLGEKIKRATLFTEHQTRLQLIAELESHKNIFKSEKCPNILEAIVIEEVFVDFLIDGPHCLYDEEIPMDVWQEYLPFLDPKFIKRVSRKDSETRKELLAAYLSSFHKK